MDSIQQTTKTILEGIRTLLTIGGTVFSLLMCFTGFRMVRQWIAFIGFVAGAVIGYSLATGADLGKDYWFLPLLVALVVGVILSALGYKIFRLGLFVFCGAVASWAVSAHVLAGILPADGRGALQYVQIGLDAIVFVFAGVLAVKFSRTAIILISAIGGARIVSANAAKLMPKYFPDSSMQLKVFAALAILGILIQFLTTKKE